VYGPHVRQTFLVCRASTDVSITLISRADILRFFAYPMMSITHSDLMPISQSNLMPITSERSDARLSHCEIVID
jgi:hypothetical protein